jgi:hypothetical protein
MIGFLNAASWTNAIRHMQRITILCVDSVYTAQCNIELLEDLQDFFSTVSVLNAKFPKHSDEPQ